MTREAKLTRLEMPHPTSERRVQVVSGSRIQKEAIDAARSLRLFDEAQVLSRALPQGEQATAAAHLARNIVREADPVRLKFAADVLNVSVPTAKAWTDAGLLEDFGGNPRRVGLESVAQVRELVREVRATGQNHDLMTAVLRRLEMDALTQDARFVESVTQMRRGDWA